MGPALARRTPQKPKEEGRPKRLAVLNKKETPGAPKKKADTKKAECKKPEKARSTATGTTKKKAETKKKPTPAKKGHTKATPKNKNSGSESDTRRKSVRGGEKKKETTTEDEETTEEQVEEQNPNVVELQDYEKKNGTDSQEEEGEKTDVESDQDDGELEDEEDSDFDPDDDPDKLWCFCKKPHSNRFMICCDTCEEWFHGDCVGISMSKGREMEKTGEEWCCKKCSENTKSPPDTDTVPIKSPLNSPLKKIELKQFDPNTLTKARRLSLDSMKSNLARSLKDRSLSLSDATQSSTQKKEKESATSALNLDKGDSSSLNESKTESITDDEKPTLSKSKQAGDKAQKKEPVEKVKVEIPGFTFDHVPSKKEEKPEKVNRKRNSERRESVGHDDETKRKRQEELKALAKAKARSASISKVVEQVKFCRREECNRPATKSSIYCSRECIYKYANESIKLMEDERKKNTIKSPDPKNENKGNTIISAATSSTDRVMETTQERIAVYEKTSGKIVAGVMAPTKKYLFSWLEEHPTYEVLKAGKQTDLKNPKRDQDELVRSNVRKSLRDILITRCKHTETAINIEAVGKLCKKIEGELLKLFGETNHKYKTKYRSLIFNLKDSQNKILYKRVVSGEILPHKLVHMTPEQLATPELARWREQESKHNLEMIKKRELEEAELLKYPGTKKTHKGEVEIVGEEDFKNLEMKVEAVPDRRLSSALSTATDMTDLLKDTTDEHAHHLFDSNCKICTGKIAPPGESQVTGVSTTVVEAVPESSVPSPGEDDMVVVGSPPSPDTSASSPLSPTPTSLIAPPPSARKQPSVWRGFVMMQKVSKFVCTAYAVSGTCENLMQILPDTIHICGRIPPGQVWDYLSQMKEGRKNQNKFIDVIRFEMSSNEEKQGYIKLYTYFYTRQRIGVVGNCYSGVKDMYILPLASHDPIPPELKPLPGLPKPRPHMLLGIIVRVKTNKKMNIDSISLDSSSPEMAPKKKRKKKERKKEKELEKERVEIEAQKKLIDIIFKSRAANETDNTSSSLLKDIDPSIVLKNMQEKGTLNQDEKKTDDSVDFTISDDHKKIETEQLKKLKEQQEEIYRLQLEVGNANPDSDIVIIPDPANVIKNIKDVGTSELENNSTEDLQTENHTRESVDGKETAVTEEAHSGGEHEEEYEDEDVEEPIDKGNQIPLLGADNVTSPTVSSPPLTVQTTLVSHSVPISQVSQGSMLLARPLQPVDDDFVMNLIEDIKVPAQIPKFPLDILKSREENKMPELPNITLPITSNFREFPLPLPGSIPKVPIPPNIKLPPGVPFPPLPPKPIHISGIPTSNTIPSTALSEKVRDPRSTSPRYNVGRRDPRVTSPYKDTRIHVTSPPYERGEPVSPPYKINRRVVSPPFDANKRDARHVPNRNPAYEEHNRPHRPPSSRFHPPSTIPHEPGHLRDIVGGYSPDGRRPSDNREQRLRDPTDHRDFPRQENFNSDKPEPSFNRFADARFHPVDQGGDFNLNQQRQAHPEYQRSFPPDQQRPFRSDQDRPIHPDQERQFHPDQHRPFPPEQQRPFNPNQQRHPHPDHMRHSHPDTQSPFHHSQQDPPFHRHHADAPMNRNFDGRELLVDGNHGGLVQNRMDLNRPMQMKMNHNQSTMFQPDFPGPPPQPPRFQTPSNQSPHMGLPQNVPNSMSLEPTGPNNFPMAPPFSASSMPPFTPTIRNVPPGNIRFPGNEPSTQRPDFPPNTSFPPQNFNPAFQPPMNAPRFPQRPSINLPSLPPYSSQMPSHPPHAVLQKPPQTSSSGHSRPQAMAFNEALSQKGSVRTEPKPRSLLDGLEGFDKYGGKSEPKNKYLERDGDRFNENRDGFDRRDKSREREYSGRSYKDDYKGDDYVEYHRKPSSRTSSEERRIPERERRDIRNDRGFRQNQILHKITQGRRTSDDLEEGEVIDHDTSHKPNMCERTSNKPCVDQSMPPSYNNANVPPRIHDEQDVWQTKGRYKPWGKD